MTFEEVKEMFKKSIDATDTMNQALENLIQSIYLKGYNEALEQKPSSSENQKMGQWFIDERPECNREVVCSNCEQPVFKYHKLDFDYRPKYCPNCGAKMSEIPTGAEGSE